MSLTAHLMRLTNSAYFGLPVSANTPKQAISFLGFENVKAILILGGVFDQFNADEESLSLVESLNRRRMQLGTLSRAIADSIGLTQEEQEQSFCAGLVGHIGTLLLATNWPKKFKAVISLINLNGYSISQAELEVFGTTHGALGAYLLGSWGFNETIVEAVAYHHYPNECAHSRSGVLLSMHVAQHLLRVKRNASLEETRINQSLDNDFLAKIGKESDLQKWEAVYEMISKDWPND
jgi:HD-like signal output (HDOD) protein